MLIIRNDEENLSVHFQPYGAEIKRCVHKGGSPLASNTQIVTSDEASKDVADLIQYGYRIVFQ